MKKIITYIIAAVIISGGFSIDQVFSAGIVFEPSTTPTHYDQSVRIDIYIDSDNESINTISGTLSTDDTSTIAEIISGNSLVSLWVEHPTITETKKSVSFSGIIPGGIVIDKGYIFSLIVTSESQNVSLQSSDVIFLKNDGQGTVLATNTSSTILPITEVGSTKVVDTVVPEPFTINRLHNASIFDDRSFIVFSTRDKFSGIHHYRICEWLQCVDGISPYELKNQSPWYMITVRAYDGDVNVRNAYLISPLVIIIIAIVIISGILGTLYGFFVYKK